MNQAFAPMATDDFANFLSDLIFDAHVKGFLDSIDRAWLIQCFAVAVGICFAHDPGSAHSPVSRRVAWHFRGIPHDFVVRCFPVRERRGDNTLARVAVFF